MKNASRLTILASMALATTLAYGQTRTYDYDFEADTVGTALLNSATFNYTTGDNSTSLAAGGTLIFRGNSGSSDYEVVSIGGSNALRIQGAMNTQTDDFGVYIGGLDFSDFAGNENKQVDFSFDILGNSINSVVDWEVNYTFASTTAGPSSFVDAPTDNLVFTFANSGGTMTTISGSFAIPDGQGSTVGGLFISGPRALDGSAAMTGAGGSLAMDNISVSVSAIPEPQTFAVLIGVISLMLVVTRRR